MPPASEPRSARQQDTETIFAHAGNCLGPVYFDLAGGFCYQCGAGPLSPWNTTSAYVLWPPGWPEPEPFDLEVDSYA